MTAAEIAEIARELRTHANAIVLVRELITHAIGDLNRGWSHACQAGLMEALDALPDTAIVELAERIEAGQPT